MTTFPYYRGDKALGKKPKQTCSKVQIIVKYNIKGTVNEPYNKEHKNTTKQ